MRLPREPLKSADATEWRRYAATLMIEAQRAIRRAEEASNAKNDRIASSIDGTYRQMLDWLTRQVDSG